MPIHKPVKLTKLFMALLSIGLISLAPCATAAETPGQELTRISEETALLNARKAELDAELKVLTAQSEIKKIKGSDGPAAEQPVLRGIEGIDGKLKANIAFGMTTVEGHKGETIHGNWKILSIARNAVVIAHGKEQFRLILDDETSSGNRAGSPGRGGDTLPLPGH